MAELSQKCDFSSAVRARGGVSVQVDTYLVGYLTCTYLEALILSSAESTSQASKPNPVCQQQGYTKMLHPPRPAQPPQPSRPSPAAPALLSPALPWSALPCPASIPEPDERTRCPRDQAINSLTLPIHSLRLRGCTWQHGYYYYIILLFPAPYYTRTEQLPSIYAFVYPSICLSSASSRSALGIYRPEQTN